MRLRGGEYLMGAAAAALVLVLFLDWFETGDAATNGWSGLWIGVAVLTAITLVCAAIVILAVQRGTSIARTVLMSVITATLTVITTIAITINVLSTAGGDTDALWPAIAGIAFAAMLTLGAWRSLSDERLDAHDSAYEQPDPRSIPEG